MNLSQLLNRQMARRQPRFGHLPQVSASGRNEMPRFPIRAIIGLSAAFVVAGTLCAPFVGNPVGRTRDPRLGKRYNDTTLTCLAAGPASPHVWMGTENSGICVYNPGDRLFEDSITRHSTQGRLLADSIADLAFSPSGLAAVVPTAGASSITGLQIARNVGKTRFWERPCIDLTNFPELTDETATCVAQSSDGQWLLIGTSKHGLGIYNLHQHGWKEPITTSHGIPSNHITDIVFSGCPDSGETVWLGTDKGLCEASFGATADFLFRRTFTHRNGLAGEAIATLQVQGAHLWYLTTGRGMGRLQLAPNGASASAHPHELLISERRLPQLDDSDLRRAAGSPGGKATWFLADLDGVPTVGRFREAPHDTAGIALPATFQFGATGCIACEAYDGNAVLLGTDDGAWFYTDKSSGPDDLSRIGQGQALPEITGGYVGPQGTPVREAVMMGNVAAIKAQDSNQPILLRSKTSVQPGAWTWQYLVGPGRFLGLDSLAEATCVAGHGNTAAYFGTRNQGIGIWDRSTMEIRRQFHADHPDPARRLRTNTCLALAVTDSHQLAQVTGDFALDLLGADGLQQLVPPSAAPLLPSQIQAVAARAWHFACAGTRVVAVYSMQTFAWHTLPQLEAIVQIELTNGMLWALTQQRELHAADLAALGRGWRQTGKGVRQIMAGEEGLFALAEQVSSPALRLLEFDGNTGELRWEVAPQPLKAGATGWRFAVAMPAAAALPTGETLCLVGSAPELHCYEPTSRNWRQIPFPKAIRPPLRQLEQTPEAIWLLDAEGGLHQYLPGTNEFRLALLEQVTHLSTFGSLAVAWREGATSGARVLLFDRLEAPQTIIGAPFAGTLAALNDAVEWQGRLVAAADNQIGFYDWHEHGWWMVASPAGMVNRLYVAGNLLWVLCGPRDQATLWAYTEGEFRPVVEGTSRPAISRVAADPAGLFALAQDGRILAVSTDEPTIARERIAASAAWAKSSAEPLPAAHSTILGEGLLTHAGGDLYHFTPDAAGVEKWRKVSLEQRPKVVKIIATPDQRRALVQSEQNAWLVQPGRSSPLDTKSLLPTSRQSERGLRITNLAAGENAALCAFVQADTVGSQVSKLPYDEGELSTIIGKPCPASGPTAQTIIVPGGAQLFRRDVEGLVMSYDLATRSWMGERGSAERLELIWAEQKGIMGFDARGGTILERKPGGTAGAWVPIFNLRGQIAQVTPLPSGTVLWLKSGEIIWRDAAGNHLPLRPPPNADAKLGQLATIVAAAEDDDLLVLADDKRQVAVYDWRRQQWLKSDFEALAVVKAANPLGIMILRPVAGGGELAGPVRRTEDGRATARPIRSPVPLTNVTARETTLFALGADYNIYRQVGDSLVPWWSGSGDGTKLADHAVLAAAELDGALRLVLRDPHGRGWLFSLDSQTLRSTTTSLGQHQLDRVQCIGERQLIAILKSAAGHFPLDVLNGNELAPPRRDIIDFVATENHLWALTERSLLRLGRGAWEPTQVAAAPLPAGEGATAFVAFGADLMAKVPGQPAHLYDPEQGAWLPTSQHPDALLWLDGDQLRSLAFAPTMVVEEYLPRQGWRASVGIPIDKQGAGGGQVQAFGRLPATTTQVAFAKNRADLFRLELQPVENPKDGRIAVIVDGDELHYAVNEVAAGDEPDSLRLTFFGSNVPRLFVVDRENDYRLIEAKPGSRPEGNDELAAPPLSLEAERQLREELMLPDSSTGLACSVAGVAWAVDRTKFKLLRKDAEEETVAVVFPDRMEGEGTDAVLAVEDGAIILRKGGQLYHFALRTGLRRLAGGQLFSALFAVDGVVYARPLGTDLRLRTYTPDSRDFLAPRTAEFKGRQVGQVLLSSMPTTLPRWKLPDTFSGTFRMADASYKLADGRREFTRDLLVGARASRAAILLQTSGPARVLKIGPHGNLVDQDIKDYAMEDFPAAASPLLLEAALARFRVRQEATGDWQAGMEMKSRLLIEGLDRDSVFTVVPGATGGAAHEQVVGLQANQQGLWAVTPGGVLRFANLQSPTPSSLSTSVGADKLTGLANIAVLPGGSVCVTDGNRWFEQVQDRWRRMHQIPSPQTLLDAATEQANAHFLSNWQLDFGQSPGGRHLRRRTPAGVWLDVRLQATGFDFEDVRAVDEEQDTLWLHTPAGSLGYPLNGLTPTPAKLTSQWAIPAEAPQGRLNVVHLGDARFLTAKSDLLALSSAPSWLRNARDWQPGQTEAARRSQELHDQPLLVAGGWQWRRATRPGEPEAVSWQSAAGLRLQATFDPGPGRFAWDICYDVGQAGGHTWLLTAIGAIRSDGAVFHPLDGDLKNCRFLDVSAGLLGGILAADGNLAWVYHDNHWLKRHQVPDAVLAQLGQDRAAGKDWRVRQDGSFGRTPPQAGEGAEKVQILADGRWDFESIVDLVAHEGICYLGTKTGITAVGLRKGGPVGLWNDLGPVRRVFISGARPTAELATGMVVSLSDGRWLPARHDFQAEPEKMIGKRWQVERKARNVAIAVKRRGDSDFAQVEIVDNDFAFDVVRAAHPINEARIAILGAEGLIERVPGDGNVFPTDIKGGNAIFFAVPAIGHGQKQLYLRDASGRFHRHENRWQGISQAQGQEALGKAQTQALLTATWKVERTTEGTFRFAIRLPNSPDELHRPLEFLSAKGVFSCDDLAAVALAANGSIHLGTAGGIQRLDDQLRLARLWCHEPTDGIGLVPVNEIQIDQQGSLQIAAAGSFLQLATDTERVTPSTAAAMRSAAARRADDPTGWQVTFSSQTEPATHLEIAWRGQPTFLSQSADGECRFAHNVIYSAFADGDALFLGTQAGLMRLASASPAQRHTARLLTRPFQETSHRQPQGFAGLGWLGRDAATGGLLATERGSHTPRRWQLSPAAGTATRIGSEAEFVADDAYADDVLVWKFPEAGRVDIQFAPGKSIPESAPPRFAGGTFLFLQLTPEAGPAKGKTMAASADGLFWLTRAGIVQYDGDSDTFTCLHEATTDSTTDSTTRLDQAAGIAWSFTRGGLYATQGSRSFHFEPLRAGWETVATGSVADDDLDIVADSPLLCWRQSSGKVVLAVKNTDQPNQPFFVNGRPAIDEVTGFAFMAGAKRPGQPHVMLATNAGVSVFASADFSYHRLFARSFVDPDGGLPMIVEIAAAEVETGERQICARRRNGADFLFETDQWLAVASAQTLFDLGYRRVHDPGFWSWSKHPQGLLCVLGLVNGLPLRLGTCVPTAVAPAFSRGKLAFDDLRGVVFADPNTVLAATPVGVARFVLDPARETATLEGLDAWTAGNQKSPLLLETEGILSRSDAVVIWTANGLFENRQPSSREWLPMDFSREEIQNRRQLRGTGIWRINGPQAGERSASVGYVGWFQGRWWIPVGGKPITDAAASRKSVWFLAGNDLYQGLWWRAVCAQLRSLAAVCLAMAGLAYAAYLVWHAHVRLRPGKRAVAAPPPP